MVGQAVGATGESPKDDPQDAGPTQDAHRHQILLLFAIIFENLYNIFSDRFTQNLTLSIQEMRRRMLSSHGCLCLALSPGSGRYIVWRPMLNCGT
jgi:hypothetical protein